MTSPLPYRPLVMVRRDLEGIRDISPPPGYELWLWRPGDEALWAGIETAAGEFKEEARALEHFGREFGPHPEEMRERCLILKTTAGEPVGTATAWRDPGFQGADWGRIHWVGVDPAHQGKGLGRLLVVKALLLLRRWHTRVYLSTQTTSWIAVHLYLTLDFIPFVTAPEQEAGWATLREKAPHPLLGPPPYARGAP